MFPRSLLKGLVNQADVGTRGAKPHAPYDHVNRKHAIVSLGTPAPVQKHGMLGFEYPSTAEHAWRASNNNGIPSPAQDSGPANAFSMAVCYELPASEAGTQAPYGYRTSGQQCDLVVLNGGAEVTRMVVYDGTNFAALEYNDVDANAVDRMRVAVISYDPGFTETYVWSDEGRNQQNQSTTLTPGMDECFWARGGFGDHFNGKVFWTAAWDRPLVDNEVYALVNHGNKRNPFVELSKHIQLLPIAAPAAGIEGVVPLPQPSPYFLDTKFWTDSTVDIDSWEPRDKTQGGWFDPGSGNYSEVDVTQQALSQSVGQACAWARLQPTQPNYFVEAFVMYSDTANRIKLMARGDGAARFSESGYQFEVRSSTTSAIYEYTDGTLTGLASSVNAHAGVGVWQWIRMEVRGSRITCYANGQVQFDVYDSTHSAPGYVGVSMNGSTVYVKHFRAGYLPSPVRRFIPVRAAGGAPLPQIFQAAFVANASAADVHEAVAQATGSLTEAASAANIYAAVSQVVASISEAAAASDAQGDLGQAIAAITENVTGNDVLDALALAAASLTEAAVAGDSWPASVAAVASLVEAGAAADVISASSTEAGAGAISEGGAAGEQFLSAAQAIADLTEAASVTDAITAIAVAISAISEAGTADDTFAGSGYGAGQRNWSALAAAASAMSGTAGMQGDISEAGTASDDPSATATAPGSISESVSAAAVLAAAGSDVGNRAITEDGSASDTFASISAALGPLVEAVTALEIMSATAATSAAISEAGLAAAVFSGGFGQSGYLVVGSIAILSALAIRSVDVTSALDSSPSAEPKLSGTPRVSPTGE